jgi:hypothetical protein
VIAAPAVAIACVAIVTLALGDVPPTTIATYLVGLAAFVLAPGIAVYRALATEPGSLLRQFAFGWATGEALLIATYLLAGALGLQGVVWVFPAAALLIALPRARRHPVVARGQTGPTAAQAWALAGIVSAFIVSAAAVRFPVTPLLSGLGESANWDKDTVYFLSLAAEAKWHWPPADPNVASLPLHYHYLSFVDIGAMSRLTGIELSELMLRFDVVAPHVLVGLLLAVAGSSLSGRWSVGVIAAALVLLLGELDLDPDNDKTFRGRFAELERDTSFHYGLLFGLPALVLIGERLGLAAGPRVAPRWGDWVLLGALLAAAAGSKAPMVLVLLGGVALFVALELVRRRRIDATTWKVAGLTASALAFALALAYPRDSMGTGLSLHVGALFEKMALLDATGLRGDELILPAVVTWPLGAIVGMLGLLAPVLLGLFLGARLGDGLDGRLRTLLLVVFAAGFLATVSFVHGGNSEEYFLWSGYPAAALVAAAGFDAYLRACVRTATARRALLLGLGGATTLALLAALALPGITTPHPRGLGLLPVTFAMSGPSVGLAALLLAAAALACLSVGLWRRSPLRLSAWVAAACLAAAAGAAVLAAGAVASDLWPGRVDLAGIVAVAAGALAASGVVAAARRGPAPQAATALAVAAILSPAMLDLPLDVGTPVYHRARGDEPAAPDPRLVTPGIAEAMRWLRDESDRDEVLIVNNQFQDLAGQDPRYFFYAALSERRTYLGGWFYSSIRPQGEPPSAHLRARLRTNRAALCGDPAALARLYSSEGVRWIVIDKVHSAGGVGPPGLPRAFSNADVDVHRVPPSGGAGRCTTR